MSGSMFAPAPVAPPPAPMGSPQGVSPLAAALIGRMAGGGMPMGGGVQGGLSQLPLASIIQMIKDQPASPQATGAPGEQPQSGGNSLVMDRQDGGINQAPGGGLFGPSSMAGQGLQGLGNLFSGAWGRGAPPGGMTTPGGWGS